MPVSISGDGAITGLELEAFEDVDVGSGAADGDVLTYDASGDLWIPQEIVLPAGVGSNVVQTVKTDTFTTTSTSYTDVTGLSATITPSLASSKILVIADVSVNASYGPPGTFRINGGNSNTYVGDASGTAIRAKGGERQSTNYNPYLSPVSQVAVYLDSPNTTSPVTYSVQVATTSSTVYVNTSRTTTDIRVASSITAIEVAA